MIRPADLSLIHLVGRVNQGIRREMRFRLARGGTVSVQEYTALALLRESPGLSNAELARRSLVTPQSMIEILVKLEQRGLVSREVDPAHGRVLRSRLTAHAEGLLDKVEPEMVALQEEMLADVSAEQREVILDGLLRAMVKLSAGLAGSTRAE
jgi:DNA-binding MarR family transcriptional regulator